MNKLSITCLTLAAALCLPALEAQVCVSPAGSDSNPGTKAKPLLSLQAALRAARAGGESRVWVATGTYSPGKGLAASGPGLDIGFDGLDLSGGWDADFGTRQGRSTLNGGGRLSRIVSASSVSRLRLEGFVLTGCKAGDEESGALTLDEVKDSSFRDCAISSNEAYAVFMRRCSGNVFDLTVTGNGASQRYWGAVTMLECSSNRMALEARGNRSGGVDSDHGVGNSFTGSYRGNGSPELVFGGGITLWYSKAETIDATVEGNSANDGGGIYVRTAQLASGIVIRGTIRENTAGVCGGGLYLYGDDTGGGILVDAAVSGNTADYRSGGGIYALDVSGSRFLGTVSGNVAGTFGGGLEVHGGKGNSLGLAISGNASARFGGAEIRSTDITFLPSWSCSGNKETSPDLGGVPTGTADCLVVTNSGTLAEVVAAYKPLWDAYGLNTKLNPALSPELVYSLRDWLRSIDLHLRILKPAWIRRYGLTLGFTKGLKWWNGTPIPMKGGGGGIDCGIDREAESIIDGFDHEFFHAVEESVMTEADCAVWRRCTPPGFEYFGYEGHEEGYARLCDKETGVAEGFLTAYCTASMAEDLAVTWQQSLMVVARRRLNEGSEDFSYYDPKVQGKIAFMERKLGELFPGFLDSAYLRRYYDYRQEMN